jgi:plastocyanin
MCTNRPQKRNLRWHPVSFLGTALMLGTLVAPIAVRAQTACVGDCTRDGAVTVDELLTMVNVALGTTPVSACAAGDPDTSGDISINEIVAAVSNALSGCTTTAPTPTPTPVTRTVVVGPGFAFDPPDLTIQVGDTVEWSWASSGHNVVSGSGCAADGQFCSPSDSACATARLSGSGTIYSHTFTAAGTFPYFCSAHCAFGMVGTITVQ